MAYYLVASLPTLELGEPAPLTPDQLLFQCQGVLSPDDWAELSLVLEGRLDEATSDFAAWWRNVDTQIRNQVARHRAGILHIEARPYQRMHSGYEVAVEEGVADALPHRQPLDRELALDRCRWNALEERTRLQPFSFEQVLAYALQLRMLDRWTGLTDEDGLKKIETFITEYAEKALES